MRDALNLNFLPIAEDEMSGLAVRTCLKGFGSTNGYYGYQPLPLRQPQNSAENCEAMETQTCDSNVKVNGNLFEQESKYNQYSRHQSRKRGWEYSSEAPTFKKRREDDVPDIIPEIAPAPKKNLSFRNPTHNLPDMPRCMMGHYV